MISAEQVTQFTDNLVAHSVTWERVKPEAITDALAREMQGMTVGTGLPQLVGENGYPADVITTPTIDEITHADTGITTADIGVANYGSVVVTPTENMEGPVSLYPPKHIAVLPKSDIVSDLGTAFDWLSSRFEAGTNDAVFITGVSSTGDMGASVNGVHGPSEVHVMVVEE